jgi:hypothetical protein
MIDPIVFDFCELACDRIGDRLQQQAQSLPIGNKPIGRSN